MRHFPLMSNQSVASFRLTVRQSLVITMIAQIPELAVVQDADRLDAIGAVGIGRCFTFGGAKGARDMQGSVDHFEEKLIKIADMTKTGTGRKLAQERTERVKAFQKWWDDETQVA
jgi:uncharacterized protein